jgi:hypothetical protein
VTRDILDYSVAVGIPAKIIKYFDLDRNEWICNENNLYYGVGKKDLLVWEKKTSLFVA